MAIFICITIAGTRFAISYEAHHWTGIAADLFFNPLIAFGFLPHPTRPPDSYKFVAAIAAQILSGVAGKSVMLAPVA